MKNDEELDQRIAGLVRSVGREAAPGLEKRIFEAAQRIRPRKKRARKRRLWLLALVSTAAAAAMAAVVLLPPRGELPPPITEIRTEFTIAGTDIKVVFFQKPDFHFFEEE
ncbi:MAG: hypothetical protein PHI34_08360 [Acidobacteriota bacterium]|nr:hypothetical protein [Acidobacteriota bacterium]